MLDAVTSSAFSVQSSKGVYALLLGSGLSTAPGIPTGWDITLTPHAVSDPQPAIVQE